MDKTDVFIGVLIASVIFAIIGAITYGTQHSANLKNDRFVSCVKAGNPAAECKLSAK